MSQYDVGIHEINMDQCRKLIAQLPGIFSAGLRFEDDHLIEIHILASTERNPKQISRDIQSAIFAAYSVEVDHRIISIAQLPSDPFAETEQVVEETALQTANDMQQVRLLFTGIDSHMQNGKYSVNVHLGYNGRIYTGEASCRDTQIQHRLCVAQATLNAVHEFLGDEYFSLLDVKQTNACGEPIYLTVLEFFDAKVSLRLIGAAMNSENADIGVVHSTLDALNRCVSRNCGNCLI